MNAIGYARVSKRAENGASLDAQERAIREEVERRGWSLVGVEREVASAKRGGKRPGLERALAACESGEAGAIVVAKLDRLSRSVMDFGDVLERAQDGGWSIVVLDQGLDLTTPNGRLVANMLISMAQWEREMIGQRTREGVAERRAQGVKLGRPSTLDKRTAARIRNLRSRGWSLRKIATRLNEEGVPTTRDGKQWYPSTVRGVLDGWHQERTR